MYPSLAHRLTVLRNIKINLGASVYPNIAQITTGTYIFQILNKSNAGKNITGNCHSGRLCFHHTQNLWFLNKETFAHLPDSHTSNSNLSSSCEAYFSSFHRQSPTKLETGNLVRTSLWYILPTRNLSSSRWNALKMFTHKT